MRAVIVPRRVGKMETVATQEEFRSRAGRRGILACGGEHEGCSIWQDVNSMDQLTINACAHYYYNFFFYYSFAPCTAIQQKRRRERVRERERVKRKR